MSTEQAVRAALLDLRARDPHSDVFVRIPGARACARATLDRIMCWLDIANAVELFHRNGHVIVVEACSGWADAA